METSILSLAKVMCFVATADHVRAKDYYSEVLGLTFVSDDEYSLIFAVGDATILRIQKYPGLVPQQFTVFGWEVLDIETAVTELAERGVMFENYGFPLQDSRGVCTFPNGDKVAWFKDPDGNTLSIAQIVR